MASVFFMQPLGQIAGNLVSLIVVAVARSSNSEDTVRTVDSMWRWVLGIGVIPGAIATMFRFAIPESPRYLVDIEDDPVTAEFDATTLFSEPAMSPSFDSTSFAATGSSIQLPPMSSLASESADEDTEFSASIPPATLNSHWRLARTDIFRYFWTEGNWRALAGTSVAWLMLDFGFYGIGLSSPQFLAKTWGTLHISHAAPNWMTDDRPGANIFDMFFNTSVHGLIVLNVGSFVGGLLLILFAHRIDRVALQKYIFLILAALFIALGIMFVCTYSGPPAVVALYIFGQILFNFGMFPQVDFPCQLLTPLRPQCNNLHDTRRDFPHSLSRYLPRDQRRLWQAWLHPCPDLLHILPFRYRARYRVNPAPRHHSFRFQCVYDNWRSCHALLDPSSSAKQGQERDLGWQALYSRDHGSRSHGWQES